MLLTTTETIPTKEIEDVIGLVKGSSVRARHVGRDLLAGLKGIIGGEIASYSKLQEAARDQALKRLQEEAEKLHADAVVNIRLTTSVMMQGASEVLAYGTAVKFKEK